MKIDRRPEVFTGQVKFTRALSSASDCRQWRAGSITLEQRENDWKLEVLLDVQKDKPALTLFVRSETMRSCTCTEMGFLLKAHQSPMSKEVVTVNFRPDKGHKVKTTKALKAISQEMKGRNASSEAPVHLSEVGLSSNNIVNPPSGKALFTTIGNRSENSRSAEKQENRYNTASPQRFTSVKENVRKHEDDFFDSDFKENIHSTPYPSNGEKYLQRALDRSKQRQNPEALGAKRFYSSTPQTTNSQWLNTSSNSSVKRTGPGLMPSPIPIKKPRLSNNLISYSMKARSTAEEQKHTPQALQGFSNLGNTCYMNAILQSLLALDTFTADLLTNNKKLLKTPSPMSLYYALAKLVFSRKRNLSEDFRREWLRNVKSTISASAKRFSGYGQHDAHEFLGQVLDQLKEEVVDVNKSTPSPSRDPAEETTERDSVNPTTVNFEFEVMHTITCLQCQEDVSKVEQFHDVSVDLPKRKDMFTPRSLQDSLSIFFKTEQIEYTCEKCGHNKSEVTHKFTRLPRVFIIHLKRYSYDQTFLRNTKMAQSVKIPSYLTLESHCEETTQPAFPVQMQHITQFQSKDNSLSVLEDKKDETPSKRKLDFPSFTFKRKGLSTSTPDGKLNRTDSTAPESGTLENKKEEEGSNLMKPLILNDDTEEQELARAIEMSLKDQEHRDQMTKDYGDDNDSNYEKVLEMSRIEEHSDTKQSRTNVEELSEEQQIELAMRMSLMDADPYHHNNYTINDVITSGVDHNDVISSGVDHAYAESYDIGPDVRNNRNSAMNEDDVVKTSLRNKTGSSKVSGLDSSHMTMETGDIIKECSKVVMSSDDQPISPGVLSDSGSEVLELFHESDGSQKLTKIEDRNKNNNSANQELHTSKYFSKDKAESFENENHEVDRNSEEKLPGGGKADLNKGFTWIERQSEDHGTGSSDTDDFELTVETESEYKKNTNKWFDNSFKSDSKSDSKTWNNVKESKKCYVESELNSKSSDKTSLKQENKDDENGAPNVRTPLSVDNTGNSNSSIVDSNGQYVRGCQLGTGKSRKQSVHETEDDNLEIYLSSEEQLLENDIKSTQEGELNNKTEQKSNIKQERTPNRHRFGQKLEDIGRKMDDNVKADSDHAKNDTPVKTEYKDKLYDDMMEKLVSANSRKEKEKKATVDKDIFDFQCSDDSWMNPMEDKENEYPRKQRPMLSDPSDVFGDGATNTRDEVDGYIDANLDIPEINNEKGELPYSYKLVSVVSHMGISSSTGHYISDVYDIKKRGWFSFDDSHVSKITESEVKSKRERSGYIFFYMSKDIFDDLCLHQSVVASDRKKDS